MLKDMTDMSLHTTIFKTQIRNRNSILPDLHFPLSSLFLEYFSLHSLSFPFQLKFTHSHSLPHSHFSHSNPPLPLGEGPSSEGDAEQRSDVRESAEREVSLLKKRVRWKVSVLRSESEIFGEIVKWESAITLDNCVHIKWIQHDWLSRTP